MKMRLVVGVVDAGPVVMHSNQLTVRVGTVGALVAEQFPAWAELPVRAVARTAPRSADGDAMNHGDLVPGNVLVADGRLAGVIDAGGLGPADPALDLVGAWHLLETGPRQVLRESLGCDDREWERGC